MAWSFLRLLLPLPLSLSPLMRSGILSAVVFVPEHECHLLNETSVWNCLWHAIHSCLNTHTHHNINKYCLNPVAGSRGCPGWGPDRNRLWSDRPRPKWPLFKQVPDHYSEKSSLEAFSDHVIRALLEHGALEGGLIRGHFGMTTSTCVSLLNWIKAVC